MRVHSRWIYTPPAGDAKHLRGMSLETALFLSRHRLSHFLFQPPLQITADYNSGNALLYTPGGVSGQDACGGELCNKARGAQDRFLREVDDIPVQDPRDHRIGMRVLAVPVPIVANGNRGYLTVLHTATGQKYPKKNT